jgi:TPR repeat protein
MRAKCTVFSILLMIVFAAQLLAQPTTAVSTPLDELRARAEKGDAIAQAFLGNKMFLVKDYAEALKWSQKAANQDDPLGQLTLGIIYSGGFGVLEDLTKAAGLFRKAAEFGLASAQDLFANALWYGRGIYPDKTEAVKWWQRAANHGNLNSQVMLGRSLLIGEGTAQNYGEGIRWTRLAAEQGHWYSQGLLGSKYALGDGVPQDYVQAYFWLVLSAAQGNKDAVMARDLLIDRMTPQQIAQGQQLAREFIPRNPRESGKPFSGTEAIDPSIFASGTGFFITEDGLLVTNQHVVGDAAQVRLVTSTGIISARVIKVDAANDLALIKAEGRFAALPVVSSRTVKLGSTVATVGFPNIGLQGFAPKLAKGEIASLGGAQDDPRYFQISVPVQPGNSGGALVDEFGNVVGVVAAKLSASAALETSGELPENVNYAVKSSFLLGFLESVPEASSGLKAPINITRKFEDVVKSVEKAAVLVLVYK